MKLTRYNIVDVIISKYPNIQGVTYWQTRPDGKDWSTIMEGLVWGNTEIPKPTKQDLESWLAEFDLTLRQKKAVEKRRYPSWQEQMEMQYNDKVNGTNTWVELIDSIKAANPKPQE